MLFHLSLFTLFGFSAIGLLIIKHFQKISIASFFAPGNNIGLQILLGLLYGFSAALIALILLKLPQLKVSTSYFSDLVKMIHPSIAEILLYSLSAGIGEEILFRGAIQPFAGVWVTSIGFIFIHGYLNPFNKPLFNYGLFLIFVSAGLGYLMDHYGIYASMISHFIYDAVLFIYLKQLAKN